MFVADRTGYSKNQVRKMKHLMLLGMFLSLTFFVMIMLMGYSSSIAKPVTIDYKYEPITVEKGDTLWTLTSKMNQGPDIPVLVNKTISYNNLSSTYIEPGQIIYIPVRV